MTDARRPSVARLGQGLAMPLAVIACAGSAVSCSALLDWTGYTDGGRSDGGERPDATLGGDADAGGPDDASPPIDAPPLLPCGPAKLCSPVLPAAEGWSGPYALVTGGSGNLPSCDPAYYASTPAFEGKAGLDAGGAQCACSCPPPQGVTCAPPNVTFYSDALCDASTACGPPTPLDRCVPIGSCPNLSIDNPKPVGGACAPNLAMTIPPSSWSSAARACTPSASASMGSCGNSQLCLPAATPFCIMQSGDVACPAAGDYPFRRVYYQGSTDQRGCSPCSCGAPSGGVCSFSPSLPFPVGSWGDPTCLVATGMPFSVPVKCAATVPSAFDVQLIRGDAGPYLPYLSTPASCQVADGGTPTGSVVLNGPTTFCCTR